MSGHTAMRIFPFTAAVVVPTNRPERVEQFVGAWESQFNRPNVSLFIIEDQPGPVAKLPGWVFRYTWEDFNHPENWPPPFGKASGCIPRRAGGIRDYGIWRAAHGTQADFIVSLDDDCLPLDDDCLPLPDVDFLAEHWAALSGPCGLDRWASTTPWLNGTAEQQGIFPRGVPYGIRQATRRVTVNHGLWANVPDLDAPSQLLHPTLRLPVDYGSRVINQGYYFALCAMNVAFRREIAPLMYFPKLPDGMKRWDDIWCGVFLKRLLDTHNLGVLTGAPCIWHDRASNVWNNLRQEIGGYEINETLWQRVAAVPLEGKDMLADYRALVEAVMLPDARLRETGEHMLAWASLWEGWDFSPLWKRL